MTLARIGNDPDLERLAAIRSIGGGREIYGAGGIRDAADLSALKAAGALIATALHEGWVTRADLEAIRVPSPRGDQSFLPSGPNCLR